MAKEIERKFLVTSADAIIGNQGKPYLQGYINEHGTEVRVRIAGDEAFLTIKSAARGATRDEYQYPIPVEDAREMLYTLCGDRIVEKVRYRVPIGDHTFEVDVFSGKNKGLILAEVELSDENEVVSLPRWLGKEVTGDKRYSNRSLATMSFSELSRS